MEKYKKLHSKIKRGHYLELLTLEIMKLLGRTEKKIDKNKNDLKLLSCHVRLSE